MTRVDRSRTVPFTAVLALIAALAFFVAVPARAGNDVAPDVLTKAQPNPAPAAPAAPNDGAAAQPRSDETGEQPKADEPGASASTDAEKLFGAIVKVTTRSVPDARSADSLGEAREGTGVVIARDGLVLTIGYLVVEADDIRITDSKGRVYPANVVANDQSSGFALLRAAVPIDATPMEFGDSATTTEREPVMIANAGGEGPSFAFIVSKRPFTGNWEYRLDYALFTSPPTSDWSGAALIDRDGKLLGIGSLIVREATEGETSLPGNVFVPIDLLKPILTDLVRQGHRAGPVRPWLGISADELQGHLFVTKVSPDGPGDRAGIEPGDIIVAVGSDAVRSQDEFYERVWARRQAGDEVPLKVLKGAEVKVITVHSMDRLAYYRPRSAI
ncbi:MAG TPA: S1C family serine protease [Casimicrobiaceae bacterium]|nr:S1C family serine protease [Casimicrobiaceae bacterium]